MTFGAIMACVEDLEFSFLGYFWLILNCIMTACYTLYMRFASTNIKLPRLGMVYYNNILTVILLSPLCLLSGEVHTFINNLHMLIYHFIGINIITGFFGVALNFSSLWCIAKTSATTYAIVGTVCKVPVTILGFILFAVPVTRNGIAFIVMGTIGGLLYAYSKLPKSDTNSNNSSKAASYKPVAVEERDADDIEAEADDDDDNIELISKSPATSKQ